MNIKMVDLDGFSVIGKEGLCTRERNISADLWQAANAHFYEVAALGVKEADGSYAGFWGAMSDLDMQYLPWEDGYSTGLYLAGLQVYDDSTPPDGWVKWTIPKRTFLVIEIEDNRYHEAFWYGINEALPSRGLKLVGAVCDYTQPSTGKNYLYFPVSTGE